MFWGVIYSFLHASEIETLGRGRKIWVCCEGEVDVGEDLVVVRPCWVASVGGWPAWVEFGEEESTEMDCSCAGDGLDGVCALLCEGWGVGAQDELCSGRCKGLETGNGEVFT